MFLRKLLVVVLPLLMCLLLAVLFPLFGRYLPQLGYFINVIKGLLAGIALACLLPLSGARRRESFSGLFFVPAALLLLLVIYQYLHISGVWQVAAFSFFVPADGEAVFLESAFLGFLSSVAIRASRYPRNKRSLS